MTKAKRDGGFGAAAYAGFVAAALLTAVLCVCVGSVKVPLGDVWAMVCGGAPRAQTSVSIISVRAPRVLLAALVGASLSLCGAAMQGLLKNPLADGSTLGVSSGASLGAVTAIAFGISVPGAPMAGTMVTAMLFAFISLVIILALAYRIDRSLSTNTIILIGVIYSMFVSSAMSLVIALAPEKALRITFWTMGSLSGASFTGVTAVLATLIICGGTIALNAQELNAFAVGEENARHVGVDVRRVKLVIMIAVSALIGVCVSVGGTIAFVGLVTPHVVRMITGPDYKRLLPASLFAGAIFLMLSDLVSRTLLSPVELPIGVVTSMTGAVVFVYVFYTARRKGHA